MSKQGSNSKLFSHKNDALTARPRLHEEVLQVATKTTHTTTVAASGNTLEIAEPVK